MLNRHFQMQLALEDRNLPVVLHSEIFWHTLNIVGWVMLLFNDHSSNPGRLRGISFPDYHST